MRSRSILDVPYCYILVALISATACGGEGGEREMGSEKSAYNNWALQNGPLLCPTQRATSNRLDDHPGAYQLQAMYVLPQDPPGMELDEELDTSGVICDSVAFFTDWLAGQTDDGASLRLDTFDDGVLDVVFVRLPKTEAEMMGSTPNGGLQDGYPFLRERIESELDALGHIEPNKIYAVYYGGRSPICGGGAFPPIGIVGHVGAMYLKGIDPLDPGFDPPCPNDLDLGDLRYLSYGMLHEAVHTLGFVDLNAPNHHSAGHVCDWNPSPPAGVSTGRDLMSAMNSSLGCEEPWDIFHSDGLILDIHRNDYYGHNNPNLLDLKNSIFLDPLPANPEVPPGWDTPSGSDTPCDGLCQNPVIFETAYQSGSLGTGPTCHETTASLTGANCGNFATGRTFEVNGVPVSCNGGNISLPAPRQGGYCFQASAGDFAWAYFSTW